MVKVHAIIVNQGAVCVRAELERKADAAVLEEILRNAISARLSIESSVGLDAYGSFEPVFDYPCRVVLDLVYDGNKGKVGLAFKRKPREKV